MNNEQEHSSHLTTEQLLDYLEQRLAPEKVRSVEEHLASDCVACGSELSWLQDTLKLMASADAWVDPPQRMRAAVRQIYRDHQQDKQQSFSLAAWWRSLFETPRPMAIAFAAVVALIIVGALVFQIWFNQLEPQEAQVAAVQGTVVAQPADSTEVEPITEDADIASGDLIRTSAGASVVLTYPDDSMTMVGANSEIALLTLSSDPEGATQVVVFRQDIGMTHNVVQPLTSSQSKFEIQTPAATINVRGTEFTVEVDSEGVTDVAVSEGSVEVKANGTTILLTSGEGTMVSPGGEPSTPAPVPTATRPAGFATPLSSRSKTEVDIPIDSDNDEATATLDRSTNTPTGTPARTNTPTKTPLPTTSSDVDSTSTVTPSKTKESPTKTKTPDPEAQPTATPTEPPPTEPPTSEPPTSEPPTSEPPTKEPPTSEPPPTEPPTEEPPTPEPPTEEPPTPEPPPTEPPPPDPPTPEPPAPEPYPPPSKDPSPPEPPPPPEPPEPPPPEPPPPEPPPPEPPEPPPPEPPLSDPPTTDPYPSPS